MAMMSGQERKEGGMLKKKTFAKICGNILGGLYIVNSDSGHFCH